VREAGEAGEDSARGGAALLLSRGLGGGPHGHRPGERTPDAGGSLRPRGRQRPQVGGVQARSAGRGGVHRRLAQAARLRGGFAHSLPRERRREPCADGLEHAAPGGAADPAPCSARRHGHGRDHRPGLGCRGDLPARGRGRPGGLPPHHRARGRGTRRSTSRSSRSRPATPSSVPRRSRATSPTSRRSSSRTWTRRA
jgi:hypothetical protein